MRSERIPAVAGLFYPACARELERDVVAYLAHAERASDAPKAMIVPHAGFVYSGPVAASGYRCLDSLGQVVKRVILIGPAHRALYQGVATSTAEALPHVLAHDAAHGPEHCLEVHLPFLQVVLDAFSIVPLLVGDASPAEVADVLEALWGGDETLLVVSSDLSHYHDYTTAQVLDRETSEAIEAFDTAAVHGRRACGHLPIKGLLLLAERRGMSVTRLDLRSSGDTAGPRDQVVGYGAWAFHARASDGEEPRLT